MTLACSAFLVLPFCLACPYCFPNVKAPIFHVDCQTRCLGRTVSASAGMKRARSTGPSQVTTPQHMECTTHHSSVSMASQTCQLESDNALPHCTGVQGWFTNGGHALVAQPASSGLSRSPRAAVILRIRARTLLI